VVPKEEEEEEEQTSTADIVLVDRPDEKLEEEPVLVVPEVEEYIPTSTAAADAGTT
jgi:deoxyinosine 3'endonuclease (endonuclease V)